MIPTAKGTYILILYLTNPVLLTIGRLGTFDFAAGWYAYTGSAFGSGGLRGRLNHHLRTVHKPHWHIDYLRRLASVREIWSIVSDTRYEHRAAAALRAMPGAVEPAPRFGASDCVCSTHLVYFPHRLDFAAFCAGTAVSGAGWQRTELPPERAAG